MKLPSIFDDIDNEFDRMMKEWNEFDKFLSDEIKHAKDSGENVYHFTNSYQNYFDSSDKNKNYSLSYKYETGMEEPQITIEGDVDDDTINKFVKSIENKFDGPIKPLIGKKTKYIGTSKKKEDKETKKDTKSEIKEKSYTLEMPGIAKENITTKINGKILTVEGKKDKLHYTKRFILPFEPAEKIEISADNGLISLNVNRK